MLIMLLGCQDKDNKKTLTGKTIIDAAVKVAGDTAFSASKIQFKFRDKVYHAERDHGVFSLIREFSQDSQNITDVLDNRGFKRYINNQPVTLVDSLATAYAASVNSVHYFSVLPFGLQTKAVKPVNLGIEEIGEKRYLKVMVTFDAEGGGEDYQDVFIYWFRTNDYKLDYLAYSYEEDNDIGMRFRVGYNERYIKGIRFLDYKNYKPTTKLRLEELAKAYKEGQLEWVSDIELNDIQVTLIHK